MDKIDKQREHYENVAEKYYKYRQSKNHLIFKDLLWNSFFRDKHFLKKNGLHVLEPMCGYAEGKSILENHLNVNIEYEGFDYSDTFLDIVKRTNPSIKVSKMDATKFKPIKKYDLVILIGGLHHIYDFARDFVNTIYDALNDGAYFINFEPTQNNIIYKIIRTQIYKKNPMFDYETEKGFDVTQLNDIYLSCRFKIIDQIYPGLLSYILYFNPEAFPFFNIGNERGTKLLFNIEKPFFRNFIGWKCSFATLTLLKK